jgi:hypothetical protein
MLPKEEKLGRCNMHNIIKKRENSNIRTNQIQNRKLKSKDYK